MSDLLMQIFLNFLIFGAIYLASHAPAGTFTPMWIVAAATTAGLVNAFYHALYTYRLFKELEFLNLILSGTKEARPEVRGAIQLLLSRIKEIKRYVA